MVSGQDAPDDHRQNGRGNSIKLSQKGAVLALIQTLLILVVAGKLMIDRVRYPEVWLQTSPVDPDSPLRGRYVNLQAILEPVDGSFERTSYSGNGRLEVRGEKLVAIEDPKGSIYLTRNVCDGGAEPQAMSLPKNGGFDDAILVDHMTRPPEELCLTLAEPLAFFIPEHIPDPSIRGAGEELWVRVTVPPRGAPRPIELGVKKRGTITPLDVRRENE